MYLRGIKVYSFKVSQVCARSINEKVVGQLNTTISLSAVAPSVLRLQRGLMAWTAYQGSTVALENALLKQEAHGP